VAASLQGRTAAGLLRYQAAMADTSPSRVARLMRLRDAMMTENLTDIATREADRGPTLVFAHTRHLQTNPSGASVPAPDTLEGALSALPSNRYVFTTDRLAAAIGEVTPRTDHGPEHGYFPLEADHLDGMDGVLFLREV
jgi:hypothetical protein